MTTARAVSAPRPRARRADRSSRERLLAAAAAEFATRGFAGGNVDRIARAARVNKAMIYYHFRSKAALYQVILREMFEAVAARVRVAADGDAPPEARLAAYIEAIAVEADARPHFPPIWSREIAEGGAHLDEATLRSMAGIIQALGDILRAGAAAGRFRRLPPLLVHAGIVGPLLLFFASAGVRRRLARTGVARAAEMTGGEVVLHVQQATLRMLATGEAGR